MFNLAALLDSAANYLPDHHLGLSNHLPMGLIALWRLGAGEDRLHAWYDEHTSELKPAGPPSQVFSAQDVPGYLGCQSAYPEYRDFYLAAIKTESPADILHRYLPLLLPGLSAGSLHGLIRLAYGLKAQSNSEIAAALAYWSSHYQFLGVLDEAGDLSPADCLRGLAADSNICLPQGKRLIGSGMVMAAALPGLREQASKLASGEAVLGQIAELVLELYANSRDFTVLHMLTACHALRVLQPYLDDSERALRFYWLAACTAYVEAGKPVHEPVTLLADKHSWEEIIARVILRRDVHQIKLVYSCQQESLYYGKPLYQQVAAQVLGW
ncbi:questin oxidase family protein [Chitinimonas sp. PSY-7]|uniref:questin oxidase family protein n=1 Tax=Chitinimonas sp. PSY-7 TaxID=3459088 RepID=UPI0040400DB8